MKIGPDTKMYFSFGRQKAEATNGVHVGALVMINKGASYWNGMEVERWYRYHKWYVTALDGNKATLGKDETGKYKMRTPISTSFLTVVKEAEMADKVIYTARSTDTLWGIARDFLGDPNRYKDIQRWNNLPGLVVKSGQKIILCKTGEEKKENG